MANSGLWIGVLTALTALGASYITARATSRAALTQARTTTMAEAYVNSGTDAGPPTGR